MENARLLHVVRLTLVSPPQIAAALRSARLCAERGRADAVTLFFCDLPDADARALPGDADLIRCVQSGVMSMAARRPGRYLFLVRGRRRDAAARRWLGEGQAPGARETVARLLRGEAAGPFPAANIPAGALSGFGAVLVTRGVSMLPDAPETMLRALSASAHPALRGETVLPRRREEPLLCRLLRAGFTLSPPLPGGGAQEEPPAAIYAPAALGGPAPQASAPCPFFLTSPPALRDLFSREALSSARAQGVRTLLPLFSLAALLLAAWLGLPWLAAAALLAPEAAVIPRPRQWPCALVRLALLPRRAMLALSALLLRRARGERFVRVSAGAGVGPVFGGALLLLALRGARALAPLLAVSLLWLFSPMIARALALPARERIPLSAAEHAQLRRLAGEAFDALQSDAASPAHLLAACAGCMLGLLEADEAARRAQAMLPRLAPKSAFDLACLLCAAQLLSDRMAQCDAALRPLPGEIEAAAAAAPAPDEGGSLAALLRAAWANAPAAAAQAALQSAGPGPALDALFLPRERMTDEAFFPVTHPHAFLARQRSGTANTIEETAPVHRFLILACAALNAPFDALLLRAPRIAPFAPLLDAVSV